MDALIGHTGFVGSNLKAERNFDFLYSSRNIAEIEGRSFDLVVSAGVTAVKWWANQHPEEDRAAIEKLMRHLDHVQARRFVLISTVDVYATPVAVTEDDAPEPEALQPYGRHRALLEKYIAERFAVHQIIRLPALFGSHLKKNALYDLIHDNRVQFIQGNATFQWYPLSKLTGDLERLGATGLKIVNFATEPIAIRTIQERFFPSRTLGADAITPARYDMRTRHNAILGGEDGYMFAANDILRDMGNFVGEEAR